MPSPRPASDVQPQRRLPVFWSDTLLALSVANVCLLRVWFELLPFVFLQRKFPIGPPPCRSDFAAGILNVLGLTACLSFTAWLVRRGNSRISATVLQWGVLALLFFPFNWARVELDIPIGSVIRRHVALQAGVPVLLVLIWRYKGRVASVGPVIAAMLVPFVVMTLGQTTWGALAPGITRNCSPPEWGPLAGAVRAAGVIWIVFDELDQDAVFDQRPRDLSLPGFDALRSISFVSKALPPARQTVLSMSALIRGTKARGLAQRAGGMIEVSFEEPGGPRWARWGADADVFSDAADLGAPSGVVGWFLPYCRAFHGRLATCTWATSRVVPVETHGVFASAAKQLPALLPWFDRRRHIESYERLMDAATRAVTDPRLGMVLVHLPVPHAPGIYDRVHATTTVRRVDVLDSYFENVALADRSLADLRTAMQKAGTWQSRHVIVTSDHPWRLAERWNGKRSRYVPLIVKLAGVTRGTVHPGTFDTIRLRDLTSALLRGTIADVDQLRRWIEADGSPAAPSITAGAR